MFILIRGELCGVGACFYCKWESANSQQKFITDENEYWAKLQWILKILIIRASLGALSFLVRVGHQKVTLC